MCYEFRDWHQKVRTAVKARQQPERTSVMKPLDAPRAPAAAPRTVVPTEHDEEEKVPA